MLPGGGRGACRTGLSGRGEGVIKGTVVILSVLPAPQALLQSPGPSAGPLTNRRNLGLSVWGRSLWGQAPLCARGGRARGLAARGGDGLVGAGPRGPRAGTAAVGALPVHGSSKLRAGLGGRLPTVSPSFLLQPSETTDLVSQGAQPSGEPQGRCRASRGLPGPAHPAASTVGGGGPR